MKHCLIKTHLLLRAYPEQNPVHVPGSRLQVKRASRFLFVALFVCTISSCSSSPTPLVNGLDQGNCPLDSAQSSTILKYMQLFPNGSEASIALLEGDSTSFFGARRQNDSLRCVDNRSAIFEIGSVTKTFTATILAKMAYEGKIDLDTPISQLLPIPLKQSALSGEPVTLRTLANHTAGLPKEPDNLIFDWTIAGGPYRYYDQAKLDDYLSNWMTLHSVPGEVREYSNLGVGLLGHLLTLVAGTSYEDLLQQAICEPLGLQQTFLTIDRERQKHLVAGRDPQGNVAPNWELNALVGSGGIKSTAEDMTKYLRMHLTDTTYYYLTQRPTFQYTEHNTAGLGWAWYSFGPKNFVDATGGTGGYACCVIFERYTQTGIVLLTNVSAFLASKGDYIVKMSRELYDPISD